MSTVSNLATQENLSKKRLASQGKFIEEKRICSEYIERERSYGNEAVKKIERPKVANFLLQHHSPNERLRLLSLPSIHWSFEHLLMEMSPEREYRFFGLEWTWGVVELGRPFMPGGRSMHHTVKFPIGEIKGFCTLDHDRDKKVFSHFLWVEAGSFLCLERTDRGDSKSNERFARVYKRNTAIWLDFTSPMCAEVQRCLTHVGGFCHAEKLSVPIAITMMAARDENGSDETRVPDVCKLLNQNKWRQFSLTDSWKYNHHGIPMLTVCGLATLRKPWPSPEDAVRLHEIELKMP